MSSERIYYNFDLRNPDLEPIESVISATRLDSVLNKPSDYNLAVVRFTIPKSSIPIRNSKSLLNQFSFSLDDNVGNVFTDNVLSTDTVNGENVINSFQDFTDAINASLVRLFTLLTTANPGLTSTIAPRLIYTESEGLFFFKIDERFVADNIDIYFNELFFQKFLFPSQLYNPVVVNNRRLRYFDNGDNTSGGFINYSQEFKSVSTLTDFKRVLFFTNSIPVEPELIGNVEDLTQNILTDFDPLQESPGNASRISFYPQGPYRYYNLKSDKPLKRLDLTISYLDENDIVHPVLLQKNQFINVKILFEKRSCSCLGLKTGGSLSCSGFNR